MLLTAPLPYMNASNSLKGVAACLHAVGTPDGAKHTRPPMRTLIDVETRFISPKENIISEMRDRVSLMNYAAIYCIL